MVEKLEEEENISIEFEVVPDDQYDNLMKMRLNSHEAPDLIAYQFADLFAAVDPEEFFVSLDDESWASKVKAPELTEYNGKHYGYCFEASNGFLGLIYNKDVFEANGITELPKTLDEFYAVCDKLKEAGIVPIAMPSDTWVPQVWMTALDYYRIFYYVAQYKSFSKAAEVMGNNQPNITRSEMEPPYDGAKKMILVDDVDNRKFLCELVESMWEELPKKKEKNCK